MHALGDAAATRAGKGVGMIAIFSHPWLAALALVVGAVLVERIWIITAAAVALVLRGPYRGQDVTKLDRIGFFATAAALLCAPVFIIGAL